MRRWVIRTKAALSFWFIDVWMSRRWMLGVVE